ncbi:MAG: hypothetical protein V1844_13635 [Pseudomonadota bacterium]
MPIVRTRGKKRSNITLVVMGPGKYPPGFGRKPTDSKYKNGHVWQPCSDQAYLVGNSALEMGLILNRLAFGEPKPAPFSLHSPPLSIDLLNLAGENGIYGTNLQKPRARILKAGIRLETPAVSHQLGIALGEMAARMSLGATEITLPIAGCGNTLNPEILFEIHEDSQASDEIRLLSCKTGDPRVIRIQGNPRTLPNALRKWVAWAMADGGPGCGDVYGLREQVAIFKQLVSGNGYSGRRLHAEIIENPSREFLKANHRSPHKPYGFDPKPIQIRKEGRIEDYITWTGEIEALLELASSIPKGRGKIQGLILLSKPMEKRSHIRNVLEEICRSRGYEPGIVVLNAYKPGLSWLMEVILPELKCGPAIEKLGIFYKPFVGMEGALELRSRWLQELFPVAELMAGQMGLENHQIHFIESPDQQDTYRILARSASDAVVMDKGFSPRWARMMYMEGRPDLGHVHPTTGGIRLWQDGHTILDQPVATDRERFWQTFQKNWLPALMDTIRPRLRERPMWRSGKTPNSPRSA